jgi:hypothetical protein
VFPFFGDMDSRTGIIRRERDRLGQDVSRGSSRRMLTPRTVSCVRDPVVSVRPHDHLSRTDRRGARSLRVGGRVKPPGPVWQEWLAVKRSYLWADTSCSNA